MAGDLRISGAATTSRSECDIRLNYLDPSKIIAASNDTGTFIQAQFNSTDGGVTWGQTSLALQTGDSLHSDPAVDWTSDGVAWAITIGIDATQTNLLLRCYKSTDNGGTWTFDSTPSGTQTNVDREIMWVDHSPASSHRDQIYVTWHAGTPVQFARRTTGSGAAWQTPIQVSGSETTGLGIGGDVKTNANGDVFVFWQDADGSQKVYVRKSTDGGATFPNGVVTIATLFANSRKLSIPADAGRKSRVYVSGGAWRTDAQDNVYAAWADLSGESGCTTGSGPGTNTASTCKTRIWFCRSVDGGATWAAPFMVNNQSSLNDQAFPRLAVDETNGQLALIYYDTVADTARIKTDLYMQASSDGGATWSPANKISSGQTDETASTADSGNQYGDYTGMSGYGGLFFPAWTDRRNGAREEIWTSPTRLALRACAFVIERSTLGADEIDARRRQPAGSPGGLPIQDAFRVVVDGFAAGELGLTAPGDQLAVASPIAGLTISCTGNTSTTGDYGTEIQRFTFHYTIDFPDDSAFGFAGPTDMLTLDVTAGGLPASGQIELIKQPNPFILHGDPTWLSVDLRVLVVRAGETRFGVTMGSDASAAPVFVQQVMAALTSGSGSAGGQSFTDLSTDEASTSLYLYPTDGPMGGGQKVFNFALAKVHYIGLIGATDVRVFFRLFQAQSTSAAFDYPPGAAYRRATSNPDGQPIPLAGIVGSDYVTIPCFANARVDTSITGMDQQTDDPYNVQTFSAKADGSEVDGYFGCWLDINQPFKADGVTANTVLPVQTPASNVDGPFPAAANPVTIQQAILRSLHQCLIAEIAFDPVMIPLGKDPSNWDKLANATWPWSDVGSANAVTTFEIKPTPAKLPNGLQADELMIDWGGTPTSGHATIYLPATRAADIVEMADRKYATHRLQLADAHTIKCPVGGITYVPIPPGTDINYAGLLSVALPEGLPRRAFYTVVVRQVTNATGVPTRPPPPPPPPPRIDIDASHAAPAEAAPPRRITWRRVSGAFQLNIPVGDKVLLLEQEERQLSVLRWIGESIPKHNRWYLVFRRYLEEIAGRVTVFGGDPGKILPSPNGDGRHPHSGPGHHPKDGERRVAFTGKISGLIFDRFGDFEGFTLDTEDGERRFESREHPIRDLAEQAWRERILISVIVERHAPHRPESIVFLQPSRHHEHDY